MNLMELHEEVLGLEIEAKRINGEIDFLRAKLSMMADQKIYTRYNWEEVEE